MLVYVIRWHRDNMPLPITDASFGDMESIKKVTITKSCSCFNACLHVIYHIIFTWQVLTDEELRDFKPVPSGLKKGHASFHHPLLVHGSYANRSVLVELYTICVSYKCPSYLYRQSAKHDNDYYVYVHVCTCTYLSNIEPSSFKWQTQDYIHAYL